MKSTTAVAIQFSSTEALNTGRLHKTFLIRLFSQKCVAQRPKTSLHFFDEEIFSHLILVPDISEALLKRGYGASEATKYNLCETLFIKGIDVFLIQISCDVLTTLLVGSGGMHKYVTKP